MKFVFAFLFVCFLLHGAKTQKIVFTNDVNDEPVTEEKTKFSNPAEYKDYKLVLLPGKDEYYLGENILIHYCLINTGKHKLTVSYGGDYRGSWRALRYKTLALTATGDTVPDPYPEELCFGGLGGDYEIASRDTFLHTLPLNDYVRITQPGTYTLYVMHDLGWSDKSAVPVGKITLEIKMPDEKKAEALVEEMCKPVSRDWSYHKMRNAYPEFRTIRSEIYLEALKKKTKAGCPDAYTGIGSIPTVDATRFLLDELQDADTSNTLLLSSLLIDRLPIPEPKSFWTNNADRNWKIKNGWKYEFTAEVEKIALSMLKMPGKAERLNATYILECVATVNSLKSIMDMMTQELELSKNFSPDENLYPAPASVLGNLINTALTILKTSKSTPTTKNTTGEALLYILKMHVDDDWRPGKCYPDYAALISHPLPAMRHAALIYLKLNIEDEIKAALRQACYHEDVTTRNLAMEVLSENKCDGFQDEILWNLETGENEWLLRSAFNAACKNDLRFDAMQQLVLRLNEEEVMEEVMHLLAQIVEEGSGSFSGPTLEETELLQDNWTIFLSENEEGIRSGRIFHVRDRVIFPALFPAGYEWYLNDGSHWPVRK